MEFNPTRILQTMAGATLGIALVAGAQTPAAPAAPAETAPAAAPATPAAPTWSVGPMDVSGFIDAYYSYDFNSPKDQLNDLYNFNDKTDGFYLNAAKLTLNHDPDPIGAHIDLIYGNTDRLVNGDTNKNAGNGSNYIEQAFLSIKPPKAKGFELDLGKFVTSAGAEVIESKDNWNYTRSLLFAWAIPYFHIGARASMPVSKTETIGVQVVNGWNADSNGAAIVGLTSAYVKPKYTWNVNYYGGPENAKSKDGMRNLVDTTLLLTPNAKFNAYINYDYGQNRDNVPTEGDTALMRWQGIAVAAREQVNAKSALAGRFEYFKDYQGFSTGTAQELKEFTGTYEYKWVEGLLARFEYRGDFSNQSFFHKNDSGTAKSQSTITAGFVAFFGPKR